jgi:hypothetical protein
VAIALSPPLLLCSAFCDLLLVLLALQCVCVCVGLIQWQGSEV